MNLPRPATSKPLQPMRGPRPIGPAAAVAVAAALLVPAGDASAQNRDRDIEQIAGKYEVKFEEVQSSCSTTGMNLQRATVELSQKGRNLQVTIPAMPVMSGRVSRGGRFKAEAKKGGTAIRGVDGRFTISGRVNRGVIQLVLIAEYFQGRKPLCTQSWNGSGVDKDRM
jgi:hypothetical protein